MNLLREVFVISAALAAALNAQTTFEYDTLNRLTRATYSDRTTITYVYDAAGNRLSEVISNPAISVPTIGVDKTNLSFSLAPGQTSSAQVITLTNSGGGSLQWNVMPTASWLNVTPATGTNNSALNITASAVGLTPGSYPGNIQVLASASNSPVTVSATLIVTGSSMSLSRTSLNFSVSSTLSTSPQQIAVNFTAGGGLPWSASSNQPNITISPASGTGNGVFMVTATPGPSGVITVTAPGATNSPRQLQVNVTSASNGSPYGSFDTPVDKTIGITGAVPVTGWALDNVEVTTVGIWREPIGGEPVNANGLVFIGNGIFVAGARPDVEALYPNAPLNYRGGWGYQLLTNFLPNSDGSAGMGNGTYKLHAIAVNKAGNQVGLGTKTIMADNAHATKPFGTIDTPGQGGTISGTDSVNFGWALTPQPGMIPTDGSTMTVVLDGVVVGHPVYNQYRSDIANLFPGYANSGSAVGFFHINTTTLANGVHTISWNAFDNLGHGEGLGSRYFNVQNTTGGGNLVSKEDPVDEVAVREVVRVRQGVDLNRETDLLNADADGLYSVTMEEVGRIELHLGAVSGNMVVQDEPRPLPIGSTLKGGIFYWQPGPGFVGNYHLLLVRSGGEQVRVQVKIVPKAYQ